MLLTNKDIYEFYEKLALTYNDNTKYFPARINFIIQKNKKVLSELAKMIEESRQGIAKQYGTQDLEDRETYHIPLELRETVQKELNDLMEIKHEVPILQIGLKDIDKLEFTSNQMEAIMFMIDESQV